MTEDYNLYPLHVFRTVARLGSVTQAAKVLGVSQPAVSAQLRGLEARYGAPLLERTPRGVHPTPEGSLLADYAGRILAQLEDVGPALSSISSEPRGEVMVGASSTPGAFLLPGLIKEFRVRHPQVACTLTMGDSEQVLAWLQEYRIPLGVVGETAARAGIARELIAEDELRLVTAPDDTLCRIKPIRSEYLAERTLLIREYGSSTRAGGEALLGGLIHGFGRVVEMTSGEAIKQAVAAGLGVSVLSSWATRLEEQAGLLRPVRDDQLRRPRRFYLARRADRDLVGAAATLWRFLCENASQEAGLRKGT